MTELRTIDGRPSTPAHGHTGWPVDQLAAWERQKRGLPVYHPTDPVSIDQTPFRQFATERGPNSA